MIKIKYFFINFQLNFLMKKFTNKNFEAMKI